MVITLMLINPCVFLQDDPNSPSPSTRSGQNATGGEELHTVNLTKCYIYTVYVCLGIEFMMPLDIIKINYTNILLKA